MRCSKIGFFLLLCMVPGAVWAQKTVRLVEAGRYEMTKKWDAAPDSAAWRIVAPYRKAVDSIMSPVLGESEVYMWVDRPESPLSNFVADVLLDASVRVGKKADIGLCNMGGLRSTMPKGPVTYGHILEISPFENKLCILALKGNKLLELMEQIAAVGGEGVSRGVKLVITKDGRLLNAEINGKPIDPNGIYVISTLDYLSEGNDRLYALKDHLFKKETDFKVRDLLMEAVMYSQSAGRKVTAKVEGRITKQ